MFRKISAFCVFLFPSFAFASGLVSNIEQNYEPQAASTYLSVHTVMVCECWVPCKHPNHGFPLTQHGVDMVGEIFLNPDQTPIEVCRKDYYPAAEITPKNCRAV